MTLKWSKDVPAESGWYWCREMGVFKVVRVEIVPDYGAARRDGVNPSRCSEWDAEWAGPIPMPDDPQMYESLPAEQVIASLGADEVFLVMTNRPGSHPPTAEKALGGEFQGLTEQPQFLFISPDGAEAFREMKLRLIGPHFGVYRCLLHVVSRVDTQDDPEQDDGHTVRP